MLPKLAQQKLYSSCLQTLSMWGCRSVISSSVCNPNNPTFTNLFNNICTKSVKHKLWFCLEAISMLLPWWTTLQFGSHHFHISSKIVSYAKIMRPAQLHCKMRASLCITRECKQTPMSVLVRLIIFVTAHFECSFRNLCVWFYFWFVSFFLFCSCGSCDFTWIISYSHMG